jgi:chorismate synthase
MQARIREATLVRKTLGGVIEVAATGLPTGLGSYASGIGDWKQNWRGSFKYSGD